MAKRSTVTIQGLDEMQKILARYPNTAKDVATVALLANAKRVAVEAKRILTENKSVITGDLRKSIRAQNKTRKKSGWVRIKTVAGSRRKRGKGRKSQGGKGQTDPFYAPFVEFGTKKNKAKPFLRPAFDIVAKSVATGLQNDLADATEKLVKKFGKKSGRI